MTCDVRARKVCLRYGREEVLKNLSFDLKPGLIYGLIGRNGAGKTSLLSLLASYNRPTAGSLLIGGEDPFENPRVMPQVSFVYPSDYSEEYDSAAGYLRSCHRYRPFFDLDYAKGLAGEFRLPLKRPVKSLSRGQQSALNLVMGLASRCPVTIFDEIHLALDAPAREIFYREVLEDRERHPRIMVISTHLVSEMEYLFDHVLLVHQGELLVNEPLEEVLCRGWTLTGEAGCVDSVSRGKRVLAERTLGGTKEVTLWGALEEDDRDRARTRGLQVGSVALQDLLIHLTAGEAQDVENR
ncbi:ABC-2 type transport system ATP-binding protein [Alkalispirochaeta americana]|uniref:ABC-2 type transport system ATP-binding protein n=1 Tax=Alkalispirochaeta americana TaxID=159291 RepID=A0A1N6RG51_9SPIO|nr:ABC transporter ATP-binding protein [Alkalispirochaeta americana]SIQ27779.1 ABC-2 type transport system ATP-binding protein [Alkalispirochaeta americana]